MKAKLIKHGHSYALVLAEKLVAFAHPEDFSKNDTIGKLSLKNCQSIERGYDLDELAKTIFPDKIFTTNEEYETPIDGFPYQWGFKVGFQKALELMGDKKFSDEDVKNIFAKTLENAPSTESHTRMISDVQYRHFVMDELYDRITKSLQTEWDVEIEMQRVKDGTKIIGAVKGVKGSGSKITTYKSIPKLDADECLILKLKSE